MAASSKETPEPDEMVVAAGTGKHLHDHDVGGVNVSAGLEELAHGEVNVALRAP
jgi:hypothetical protein